jgi:hypothetical protein
MRYRPQSSWLGSDGDFHFIDLKCGVSISTRAFDIMTGKLENWKAAEAIESDPRAEQLSSISADCGRISARGAWSFTNAFSTIPLSNFGSLPIIDW